MKRRWAFKTNDVRKDLIPVVYVAVECAYFLFNTRCCMHALHVSTNRSGPLGSTDHLTSFTFCSAARNAVWIPFTVLIELVFPRSQQLQGQNRNQTTLLIPKGKFVKSFWPWISSGVLLLAAQVNTALPNTSNVSCRIASSTVQEIAVRSPSRGGPG